MKKMIAKLANKSEKVGQVILGHELVLRSSTESLLKRSDAAAAQVSPAGNIA
jgi:hypothetical protein